mmetsp:Transcript_29521/g.90490  ORF Transcript_29521/g.90490 Transcript_29521/m.90490 type:complete len:116 (+) Transcript_29521:85-432(+)
MPQRGRPKPQEPKRSQAIAPSDHDMPLPPSPPQQPQREGTGKIHVPPEQQSLSQALPPSSCAMPPTQGPPMVGVSSMVTPMEATPSISASTIWCELQLQRLKLTSPPLKDICSRE